MPSVLPQPASDQRFPGGHRALEPPDPIPNSEVKRCIANDSVGPPHAKVGHRQGLSPNPHQTVWVFFGRASEQRGLRYPAYLVWFAAKGPPVSRRSPSYRPDANSSWRASGSCPESIAVSESTPFPTGASQLALELAARFTPPPDIRRFRGGAIGIWPLGTQRLSVSLPPPCRGGVGAKCPDKSQAPELSTSFDCAIRHRTAPSSAASPLAPSPSSALGLSSIATHRTSHSCVSFRQGCMNSDHWSGNVRAPRAR
jgi:hypothetical protein